MGLAMGLAVVPVVAGCAATRTVEPADEEIVVATLPPRDTTGGTLAASNAGVVDVLAAGAAAAAALGGEVVRAQVVMFGYAVQLRDGDAFTDVELDVGFGVVAVTPDEDGRRDADELPDEIDLPGAIDAALVVAADIDDGALVMGAEIERDGYDIDVQFPSGAQIEVRLADDLTLQRVVDRSPEPVVSIGP